MATSSKAPVWDIETTLRRMEKGHYNRYIDTYRRVAVVVNALEGIPFAALYHGTAREALSQIRDNVARKEMVSDKLLSGTEQQSIIGALEGILHVISADTSLYALCTNPLEDPVLKSAFQALDCASPYVCVPFMRDDFDPAAAKTALDDFLGLVGESYTYKDLYDRSPALDWKAAFNRITVAMRRANLLIELRGVRKPPAPFYVSDPADDRWDVRSCVGPENAALFSHVHMKINTMAYLMGGLVYGDFFDLPMADEKILPHFKKRALADNNYWFTPLEQERIAAAIDEVLNFLQQSTEHKHLTFRQVYSDPDAPAEVMIQFQRMRDVKPELCLPFMDAGWDHTEAAEAIDVFLVKNAGRTLKDLYTDPNDVIPKKLTQSEFEQRLKLRAATQVILRKTNNLECDRPGLCLPDEYEYCSSNPYTGNCAP